MGSFTATPRLEAVLRQIFNVLVLTVSVLVLVSVLEVDVSVLVVMILSWLSAIQTTGMFASISMILFKQ